MAVYGKQQRLSRVAPKFSYQLDIQEVVLCDVENADVLDRGLEAVISDHKTYDGNLFLHEHAHVGMEIFLEFSIGNAKEKAKTSLVGYIPGKYLIVESHNINGLTINYDNSQNIIIVRYFKDGSVFGFHTYALHMMGTPYNLTFLCYPDNIEEVSLRKSQRIFVVIPIRREKSESDKECIMNLSADGALMQLEEPVALDQEFRIAFVLPDGTTINSLRCIVKRVEILSDHVQVGVMFNKEDEQITQIRDYLNIVEKTLGRQLGNNTG